MSDIEFGFIEALAAHFVDKFDEQLVLSEGTQFLRSALDGGETHADQPAVIQLLDVHGKGAVRQIEFFGKLVDIHFLAVVQELDDA